MSVSTTPRPQGMEAAIANAKKNLSTLMPMEAINRLPTDFVLKLGPLDPASRKEVEKMNELLKKDKIPGKLWLHERIYHGVKNTLVSTLVSTGMFTALSTGIGYVTGSPTETPEARSARLFGQAKTMGAIGLGGGLVVGGGLFGGWAADAQRDKERQLWCMLHGKCMDKDGNVVDANAASSAAKPSNPNEKTLTDYAAGLAMSSAGIPPQVQQALPTLIGKSQQPTRG